MRVRRDDLLTIQVDGTKGSAVAGLRDCWIQPYGSTPRPVWNPDAPSPIDYFESWQKVPEQATFENAFKRLVASRSVTAPSRGKNDLVKKEGVSWLVGKAFTVESQPQLGQDPKYKLMPFQIDGVNWLCHNWNTNQNCILADEMGLVSARSITGP